MPETDPSRVFISYSSRNRGFISTLYEDLVILGLNPWLDLLELPSTETKKPSEDIEVSLRSGIDSCGVAIVLLNAASLSSQWVQYEINYIIHSSRTNGRPIFVPITDEGLPCQLPFSVKTFEPIDFKKGYMMALAQLVQRMGVTGAISSSWRALDLATRRTIAGRRFDQGIALTDHLSRLSSLSGLSSCVARLALECANIDHFESALDLLGRLAKRAETSLNDWRILYGNDSAPQEKGIPDGSLLLSTIPPPWSPPDPSALLLASFFRSHGSHGGQPNCTIAAEYDRIGSGSLWVAYDGSLHHYTLGSADHPPRLLMEGRRMGGDPYIFVWSIKNPPSEQLWLLQASHNKAGRGLLAAPFASVFADSLQATRGHVKRILSDVARGTWMTPVTRQEGAVLGHLCLGGMFPYEVYPPGGITPTLALQLEHLLTCAGAFIVDEDGVSAIPALGHQRLSVSRLHSDILGVS